MKWILTYAMVAASSVGAVTVGDWDGDIHIDSMTDEETIILSTYNSVELMATLFLGLDSAVPQLAVIFTEGNDVPIVGVKFNECIGYSGSLSTCLTRIDDNPAVEYTAVIDNSHESIIIHCGSDIENKELYANLLRGNELQVRFSPTGQSQITASFSLSGITRLSREMGIDVDHYLTLSDGASDSQVDDSSTRADNIIGNRFTIDIRTGIISDNITGLEWFAGPEQSTTYNHALKLIADLAEGWRMPTVSELIELSSALPSDDLGYFESFYPLTWASNTESSSHEFFTDFGSKPLTVVLHNGGVRAIDITTSDQDYCRMLAVRSSHHTTYQNTMKSSYETQAQNQTISQDIIKQNSDPTPHSRSSFFVEVGKMESDSMDYTSMNFGYCYSPIRFADLGCSYLYMKHDNRVEYGFMTFIIALKSPAIWGVSARAGTAYHMRVSQPDDLYYTEGMAEDIPALANGIRPFAGIDILISDNLNGIAVTFRTGMMFIEEVTGPLFAGISFSN